MTLRRAILGGGLGVGGTVEASELTLPNKGDMFVGDGVGPPAILAAGANEDLQIYDSTQPQGIRQDKNLIGIYGITGQLNVDNIRLDGNTVSNPTGTLRLTGGDVNQSLVQFVALPGQVQPILQVLDSASNVLFFFSGTGSATFLGPIADFTGLTTSAFFSSGKLRIRAPNGLQDLVVGIANMTALRTLTVDVSDANRTVTLTGNPTLADWFDQGVKTTSSPLFAGLTVDTGVDQRLITKAGVAIPTAVVLSAENDAGSANIPLELRSTRFYFADTGPTSFVEFDLPAAVQFNDQDATPVADRRLQVMDGLFRSQTTGNVEGRFISRASLEQIVLTTDVTGELPVVNGGTGASTVAGAQANLQSPIPVYKAADESVTSSAAVQDDDHLLFSIAANQDKDFEIVAMFDAGVGAGVRVAISGPATPDNVRYTVEINGTDILAVSRVGTAFGTEFTSAQTGTNVFVRVRGTIENGSNAGTVRFRFAQNVSNVNPTTCKRGSVLKHQTI